MDVSIVIPTKNAGPLFEKVLDMIFSQKTIYEYEVICVDSGSKDQTLEVIKKYPCKLYQIPASEFGHGKTRNYGASKGTGTYIVFITQDALPATETWLQNFIDAMKKDPEVVGGFGIHYPYPGCNFIDKRDIEGLFQGFGSDNTIFYMEDKERYEREEGYRHVLAFFSDNNSCVRRDVFEQHPYDDVNFAEDQIWARKMIELGYKKVYCPFAPVYHSHNFKLSTYFARYYDEYKGLYEIHQYMIFDSSHVSGCVRSEETVLTSVNSRSERKQKSNGPFTPHFVISTVLSGGHLAESTILIRKQNRNFWTNIFHSSTDKERLNWS